MSVKELSYTGRNGAFTGKVIVAEKRVEIPVNNPSTHETETRFVPSYMISGTVGNKVLDCRIVRTYEQDEALDKVLQYMENLVISELKKLANEQDETDSKKALLLNRGYK